MEKIYAAYARLLSNVDMSFSRYLYNEIDWNNRLIIIKGAKGVGKTTMLLQHIRRGLADAQKALYVSVDNLWFSKHTILELADYHYLHGGTHLFIDEVHKYKNWAEEIKNIYDSYPNMHVVVTGSCMLKIEECVADLSRRARQYTMAGLSFREYLALEGVANLPVYDLPTILANHFVIAQEITQNIKVIPYFERYIQIGYYPFYREDEDGFYDRLSQVVSTIIETEIPAVGNVEYEMVYRAKSLLAVMAERTPFTVNISSLTQVLSLSRNSVIKLLELLDKAGLIRRLFSLPTGLGMFVKPEKMLFDNTALMYALATQVDAGTMRETFVASQLSVRHQLYMPSQGDLMVDDKWLFEVGGKGKKFKQIKDKPDSYMVADNIEVGFGNKIPLWMLGLVY